MNIRLAIAVQSVCWALALGAQAQVVPDDTLGGERSRVRPETIRGVESDRIEGGAKRGGNLFHSFERLNIGAGRGAYFNNPDGVENIFGRVTGNLPSDIQGTLGVIREGTTDTLGTANLFLMNPNGIVFGQGARLDLGGSFMGTTADAIGFGYLGSFNTFNPDVPSQLLTVNPSALLLGSQRSAFGQITVKGNGQGVRRTTDPIDTQDALRVPGDRTLALIGGTLNLEGATLKTAGGWIELGSVAAPASVAMTSSSEGWRFNYDGVQRFQDIRLENQSTVDASGLSGGDIQVRGRNIFVTGASQIESSTLGSGSGGRLDLIASETIEFTGSANERYNTGVFAQTYSQSTGNGGNIFITANRFSATGLVRVDASTSGSGNAGNLTFRINGLMEIVGFNQPGTDTSIAAGVAAESRIGAQGGNIAINTARLRVDRAQISASVDGIGRAGNLTVRASESVELTGETPAGINANGEEVRGFPRGLFALVDNDGEGAGGTVTIETGRLSISDGSKAQAISFGVGDSGNVNIVADVVEIFETAQPNFFSTGVFVGNGFDPQGDTTVTQGGRGNLSIRANRVSIRGGEISASTQGQGDAGGILIQARDLVEVIDTSETTGRISFISALVSQGATGQGGRVRIETNRLVVRGSQIAASTSGSGDAGNLIIRASDSVTLIGERSAINNVAGGLFARVRPGALGQGGSVRIRTGRLNIRDGSQVQVATLGDGNAGRLLIQAGEINVQETSTPNSFPTGIFAGSRIEGESTVLPGGAGGTVRIRSNRLNVDGGEISSNTVGRRRAGDLFIRSNELSLLNGSISAETSRRSEGRGGDITINAGDLILSDRARISARSRGFRGAGDITINSREQTQLTNSNIITAATRASGGAIAINAEQIRLNGDSDIQTNVQQGRVGAGNITLNATAPILAFDDSDILANADPKRGTGGQIIFNSPGLFAENYEPARLGTEQQLDRNNQVDINANAQQPGIVVTPDTSFISNSLTELPESNIDTDRLLANTCLARSQQPGRFTRPGTDDLPQSPSNATQSAYPTGTIQSIPEAESRTDRPWQMGDAIVEPQGVHRLPDGRLSMGRECTATD